MGLKQNTFKLYEQNWTPKVLWLKYRAHAENAVAFIKKN